MISEPNDIELKGALMAAAKWESSYLNDGQAYPSWGIIHLVVLAGAYERERARREALEKELAGKEAEIKLLEFTFAHIHQAKYTTVGDKDILMDACNACGFDIRNSIHVRASRKP